LTTASTATPLSFRENRFLHWMCIGMALAFGLAAFRPDTYFDWALENSLFFVTVAVLALTYRRFVFSDLSYLLIAIYLSIHEFGAHYKYSDVPLGEWLKPILHTTRNHYDRIAHFSFGFLIAYPFREIAMRSLRVQGRWLYWLPVEATLALSAVYEILEAFMANLLTPQRGEEFVGMQGDMWDSQEDMFMATVGSVAAVLIIAAVVRRREARIAQQDVKVLAAVK
jgi:putative membrane protein